MENIEHKHRSFEKRLNYLEDMRVGTEKQVNHIAEALQTAKKLWGDLREQMLQTREEIKDENFDNLKRGLESDD